MSVTPLYPLKFNPIYKAKIWGGHKLSDYLKKDFGSLDNCGESWEISGVEGDISVVADGPLKGHSLVDLIEEYKGALLGHEVYNEFGASFPLLIKFIDANQNLSIQVHPDDKLAKERHNSFGKTEMWYVIQADPGATLISGFNKSTSKEEYKQNFEGGELMSLLNKEEVDNDDVFFLPAGRVHTIGKGLLIAEIQQTSDITYRIYDFDRIDKNGQKRDLHIDEALDAIDFNFYDNYKTVYNHRSDEVNLATCPYFKTDRLLIDDALVRDYSDKSSFVVLMILEGSGDLYFDQGRIPFTQGETILVPALLENLTIKADKKTKLLEVSIPGS